MIGAGHLKPTGLYRLYRIATSLLAPVAYAIVSRKLRRQDVPVHRIHERLGHASAPRPAGQLIWFHAASVGESLSVLTLITRMGELMPQTHFLITSGTATSAELIARRLPARSTHQYAPLDAYGPVMRFLKHWQPNAGIFVESELWPLTLVQAKKSGVALALLNARLSDRSVQRWKKRAKTARFMLDQFDVLLTQNEKTARDLLELGADADRVQAGTNLKSTSSALPIDADTLTVMQDQLCARPVWIASSTHPGEEETVLAAHRSLLAAHPDLCLLLVPRHPDRGDKVAALIDKAGLTCARRTQRATLGDDTQVYLADTLGELGTWYALCNIVFLGGSLGPIGGHNPYEPAQAGAAILTGPHVTNFAETFHPLGKLGGAVTVTNASELAQAVGLWLDEPEQLKRAIAANKSFVASQQSVLDQVVDTLRRSLVPHDGHENG